MTALTLPERLAMLETEVKGVRDDLTVVKADVKDIGLKIDQVALNLAVKNAIEEETGRVRNATGQWLRFGSERSMALAAIAVAIYSLVRG